MESFGVIIIVLIFAYGVYLINRYKKAVNFRMKIIRLCNSLINEAIVERNEQKLNLFMRGRSSYSLLQLLISFKPLKLHNFFSKEFIHQVNDYKKRQRGEDILELVKIYNNCARL